MVREQDLYAPVKTFLEGQGYEVKGEVDACDVVAVRGEEPPVIVELKSHFNLILILQAVDRLSLTSLVYVAFPDEKGGIWRRQWRRVTKLCKMLGIGILLIRKGKADPRLDPSPYTPRRNPKKTARMLKEFTERVGDPNTGGITRTRILTAYRQDALRVLEALSRNSEQSPKALKQSTGVERSASILQQNHYGWFERVARGIYTLSPKGQEALTNYVSVIRQLTKEKDLPAGSNSCV